MLNNHSPAIQDPNVTAWCTLAQCFQRFALEVLRVSIVMIDMQAELNCLIPVGNIPIDLRTHDS